MCILILILHVHSGHPLCLRTTIEADTEFEEEGPDREFEELVVEIDIEEGTLIMTYMKLKLEVACTKT